jgi:penicillin-binding protein 1C
MQLASKLLPTCNLRLRIIRFGKSGTNPSCLELGESWSKVEILEAYLNLVTFRGELQGIASASRGLFDKKPHGLDSSESVILASLCALLVLLLTK